MLSRRGTTLVELLVGLTLGSIVLGAATSTLLRQQRATIAMTVAERSRGQLRLCLLYTSPSPRDS